MSHEIKVLVVDDDAAFRLSFQKMLKGMGLSVYAACSAVEALSLLRSQAVDLIFSDIKMPKMTGLEMLKELKRCRPDTPVVLVTAYPESTIDALESMASGYLCKPIKRHEIVEALRTFFPDFDVDDARKQRAS